jgi:hypothetical protein
MTVSDNIASFIRNLQIRIRNVGLNILQISWKQKSRIVRDTQVESFQIYLWSP